MSKTEIFDSSIAAPNAALTAREKTLLGFDDRYQRVRDQLRLLLNADDLEGWSRKHHGTVLSICDRVADQYPLVIFHGDVGTGKTASAECIANRLMADAGIEDSMLFRLSNRVRGNGMVGEMGTLLAEAFRLVTEAAGKNRRAVLIIDEGDSIAASRTQEHSHHEDKVAVNTLIQAIDDLRRFKGRISVILCTNRLAALDPALQRRAAILEEFRRPSETERRQLLEMDLNGLKLDSRQLGELTSLSGPRGQVSGWTFSDFRTRFYPAAVAKAFPNEGLNFDHLLSVARNMSPSRVMEDC
jgi:SpoVK/Ycf46/Vps4 family AAA+-type ATPase